MAFLGPRSTAAILGFLALGAAAGAVRAADRVANPQPVAPHHLAPQKTPETAHHAAVPHAAAPPHHPAARPQAARRPRHDGCISQRGTILVVQAHKAVPLSAIRARAEHRGNGEIIGARLCHRDGRLTYLVSVLSERGKVVHIAFEAATGRLIGAAR